MLVVIDVLVGHIAVILLAADVNIHAKGIPFTPCELLECMCNSLA
jgi:hypothetical protein